MPLTAASVTKLPCFHFQLLIKTFFIVLCQNVHMCGEFTSRVPQLSSCRNVQGDTRTVICVTVNPWYNMNNVRVTFKGSNEGFTYGTQSNNKPHQRQNYNTNLPHQITHSYTDIIPCVFFRSKQLFFRFTSKLFIRFQILNMRCKAVQLGFALYI